MANSAAQLCSCNCGEVEGACRCRHVDYPEMAAALRERIMEWGNISKLARETGYSREGISKALKPLGNMRFNMFYDITKLVEFHWCIQVRKLEVGDGE